MPPPNDWPLGELWADDDCGEYEVTRGFGRRQAFLREFGAASVQQLVEQRLVVLAAPRPRETHMHGPTLDAEAHWQAGHGTFVKVIPAGSAHKERPGRRDRGLAIHRSPTPAR